MFGWECNKDELISFDEDPHMIIFFSDSSPLRNRAKNDIWYSKISQKVVDGFGQNLVDELGR